MKPKTNVLLCILLSFFLAACGGGGGGGGNNDNPGGDPSARKLLSKIIKDGKEIASYRYDSFNRVTSRTEDNGVMPRSVQTVEYDGNDFRPSLVRNEGAAAMYPYTKYSYGEAPYRGANTKYYQTQDLDNNRNPVFQGYAVRHYLNSVDRVFAVGVPGAGEFVELYSYDNRGNLTKITVAQEGWGNDETWEFTYDDKKGAISETATPFWWWSGTMGPNNPTSVTYTGRAVGVVVSKAHRTFTYIYDSDGYPTRCTGSGDEIAGAYGAVEGTFEYVQAH
jgi:hypothetical protein